MSFSRSKASTSTSTVNESRNLNIQDVAGVTVADSAGVNITQTDQGALGVAEKIAVESIAAGADLAGQTIDFAEAQASTQSGFARGLFGDALEAVSRTVEQGQVQLGNTVTALNEIAREQTTSADERVADLAGDVVRFGLIALGVVVAGVIALRMVK